MISRILISASAGIILFLSSVHLAYTFLTHKFSPTEKQLETAMKQVAPRARLAVPAQTAHRAVAHTACCYVLKR
jgi:hypothetical protein